MLQRREDHIHDHLHFIVTRALFMQDVSCVMNGAMNDSSHIFEAGESQPRTHARARTRAHTHTHLCNPPSVWYSSMYCLLSEVKTCSHLGSMLGFLAEPLAMQWKKDRGKMTVSRSPSLVAIRFEKGQVCLHEFTGGVFVDHRPLGPRWSPAILYK